MKLLKKINHLSVAMSINTLNEEFRKNMNKASPISDRLNTLKTLHENNIHKILFMSTYIYMNYKMENNY